MSATSGTSGSEARPGERVRPGAILRAMGAAAEAVTPPAWDVPQRGASHGPSAARIEVERSGDRVVRILARCRCGETIAIECDYADPATSAAGGPKPA